MTRNTRFLGARALAAILAATLAGTITSVLADKMPPLWGYGVKSCDQFLSAAEGRARGGEATASEYDRYEDWLTGFISGLNLATGIDVFRGAKIETALKRIHAYCGGHRKEDFFTATMDLVRMLSGLR